MATVVSGEGVFPMWRQMSADDLSAINMLSDEIHPNYPEDPVVFEERFRLYPKGCFVCCSDAGYLGYAITHPWMRESIPALNSLLQQLPRKPTTYYLHDVAVKPERRERGLGRMIVEVIAVHARQEGFQVMSLVAVNNSAGFWRKQEFEVRDIEMLRAKLLSYDDAAIYMERRL